MSLGAAPLPGVRIRSEICPNGIHLNEMDMIWHQTRAPNQYVELSAPLGHQGQVSLIVFIAEKSLHPPISTLSQVVRNTGRDLGMGNMLLL